MPLARPMSSAVACRSFLLRHVRAFATEAAAGDDALKAAFAARAAAAVKADSRKELQDALDKLSLEQALEAHTFELKRLGLSTTQVR